MPGMEALEPIRLTRDQEEAAALIEEWFLHPFQPNIRSLRLCGHGKDVSCRSRRARAGTQSGGERRVRHADGQGGRRPLLRAGTPAGTLHSLIYTLEEESRGQRGRRSRLRTLSALRAAGEDPAGDQAHRRGRDVDGLRRDAPRPSLVRRQVPLLRRPRAAAARRGEQYGCSPCPAVR